MRSPAILVASIAALLVSAAAPIASAQARKPPPGKVDPRLAEAKKYFDEGAAAYHAGDLEQAIKAWEKSYEISQKPLIFESLANAWERLGEPRKARDNLARWRDSAPPEERDLLDARLKNLDARVAREDEAARKAAAEKAARDAADARDRAEAESNRQRPWLPGAVAIGVGGLAVVSGIALDAVAASKRPDPSLCKMSGGLNLCNVAAQGPITTSNHLAVAGDATWIVGAVAVAAGVALVIVRRPVTVNAEVTASAPSVVLAPTSRGVVLVGQF